MIGAIFGDILGSTIEFEGTKYDDMSKIKLCNVSDHITDDTILTCAVADWLINDITHGYYDDNYLRRTLAERFVHWTRWSGIRGMSFGENFIQWFYKAELIKEYDPINSYGNGSAMRVSPIGWYFDTLEETLRFAKISADVTHNHPEGEKGAMCIAAAIFLARKGYDKEYIRKYLTRAFGYEDLAKSVTELRNTCKWSCTCQDTVPLAVLAFIESNNYKSAIKLAISYGSDSDTIACMTGAIAEAYYKQIFSEELRDFCESKIPEKITALYNEFKEHTLSTT